MNMGHKRDPVCGMEVNSDSKYKSEYDGELYYFCSNACKEKFEVNPIKYTR